MIVVVMGVSGSGKTTVGMALAERMHCAFHDADDFHPPANVGKMAAGTPLTDYDRLPWLNAIRDRIAEYASRDMSAVFACSALKRAYRDILRAGDPTLRLVHLDGSYDLILSRMQARKGHFMPPALLRSQFETLEIPDDAITVDISGHAGESIERAARLLGLTRCM